MKDKTKDFNDRRSFIKRAGLVTLSLPAALYLAKSRVAHAEELPKITESDATAVALKYVHDATQSKERKDSAALCGNCQHYTGVKGAEWGPCAIFPGKNVNELGWCNVWAMKA